jgi:hypothetical protein
MIQAKLDAGAVEVSVDAVAQVDRVIHQLLKVPKNPVATRKQAANGFRGGLVCLMLFARAREK